MRSKMETMVGRAAVVLLCSGGLAVSAAMAQTPAQSDAPPPPPQGQQGPPPPHGPGGPGGPGGRWGGGPEHRVEHLEKALKLSSDQTAQVKALFESSRTQMEALRTNDSLTRKDMRVQGEAIHQQEEAKLEAILSPDQKAKYEAMRAKERERMEEHRGDRGGPGGPPPPPPPPPPAV